MQIQFEKNLQNSEDDYSDDTGKYKQNFILFLY